MPTPPLYGLQRRGEWLSAPSSPPQFGGTTVWAVPSLEQALEKATLIKHLHGLTVEARRIP